MRKLKVTLDRKSLQTIYISIIRPLLEYADVVWDNCTQYEANELEQIQNEAARIVTGTTKLVSIQSFFRKLAGNLWHPEEKNTIYKYRNTILQNAKWSYAGLPVLPSTTHCW